MDGKNWSGTQPLYLDGINKCGINVQGGLLLSADFGSIHSISRSRSLATTLFERVQIWFYFSLFIHSIWLLIGFSSPLFEQLDWTSWDFEHVYAAVMEHPMLDQVSSVVSVLLHKYFYCSMVQKELVLQVGSLAWTPFWEQEKYSWAFLCIFWTIFTSWLHPGWRLLRYFGLEILLFLDLAYTLLDLLGRGEQYIPSAFIPHSKGLVPATKLSSSSPCMHVAKLLTC
jgi:hypothetical protein